MRKLGKTASDSLDLLLDTVCNMFGVILLIAILVTLLSQTAREAPGVDASTAEMLQRRIATAESDLADALRLKRQLANSVDPNLAHLILQRNQLQETINNVKKQGEQVDSQIHDQVTAQTFDYTTESKKMSQQIVEAEQRKTELANAIETQDQNAARLRERINALNGQIQNTKEKRVTKLRFPKERARTKTTFSVILKYNRVYPLYTGELDKNTDSIDWTPSVLDDSETADPIRDKGLDPVKDRVQIAQLVHTVSNDDCYFGFYVYPDSFDSFRVVKEIVTQAGFEFGWEPEKPGTHLRFGKEGSNPPPL
jgi:hypothetical protein